MDDLLYAFDLGTQTGMAIFAGDDLIKVEAWKFGIKGKEHSGARWLRLQHKLSQLPPPDAVAYERVMAHISIYTAVAHGRITTDRRTNILAAHHYGACQAFLMAQCAIWEIIPDPVSPMAIKSTALGRAATVVGRGKDAIRRAAEYRWPGIDFSYDTADAAFCGLTSRQKSKLKHRTQEGVESPPRRRSRRCSNKGA